MKQNPQVSATVSPELFAEISKMAEKECRSISAMASILLQYAITEKTRNRRGSKKNNPEHNTADSR